MSDETTTPDSKTDGDKTEKAALANEAVRPPDALRNEKDNPLRAGFRNKPNKGSKAQKKKKRKK